MAAIRDLSPHDPLPEGHSVILMRRFREDAPRAVMIEMIVRNPDGSEDTEEPTSPTAEPLTLDEALIHASARADAEGLPHLWLVDRTAGPRERGILAHDGDHAYESETLQDDDMEEGVKGSDMRDRGNDGGPRRF